MCFLPLDECGNQVEWHRAHCEAVYKGLQILLDDPSSEIQVGNRSSGYCSCNLLRGRAVCVRGILDLVKSRCDRQILKSPNFIQAILLAAKFSRYMVYTIASQSLEQGSVYHQKTVSCSQVNIREPNIKITRTAVFGERKMIGQVVLFVIKLP